MFGRKPIGLIALLVFLVVLAGCSSISSTITSQGGPAKLSKEEKDNLIKQLKATFISRYPDERGLVKVYGEVANDSNRQVISVTIAASDVITKGKNATYGTAVVEDVKPGEKKSFEITTGLGIGDVGDSVAVSVIDAEFK